MLSLRHHGRPLWRSWLWPVIGLGLLALGIVLFGIHIAENWDRYSRRYAAAAFVIGILPQILAVWLFIGLGRRENPQEGGFARTVLGVAAAGMGSLFLFWAAYWLTTRA
jgi:hypothetical protein